MRTLLLSKLAILATILLTIASCQEKAPHFTIEGTISNADSTMLYIERRSLTKSELIDSVKLDSKGVFSMTPVAIDHIEFYRLKLNNQAINLVIDSTETIQVNADKETFATEYTVEGSNASADLKAITMDHYRLHHDIMAINKEVMERKLNREEYATKLSTSIADYKAKAEKAIQSDFAAPLAYYTLFLKIDGYSIFDPMDKKDMVYFRAIATSWDLRHKNSPRSKHLYDYTLSALAEKRKLEQNENALSNMLTSKDGEVDTDFYNITLPNEKGEEVSLSSLRGKYIILDFTSYRTEYSPTHNLLLNEAYKAIKDKAEIYQVSLDTDAHIWKQTASNLPWTCVREINTSSNALIKKFNIFNLPTTYILDKQGMPIKRIESTDNIVKEINKLP